MLSCNGTEFEYAQVLPDAENVTAENLAEICEKDAVRAFCVSYDDYRILLENGKRFICTDDKLHRELGTFLNGKGYGYRLYAGLGHMIRLRSDEEAEWIDELIASRDGLFHNRNVARFKLWDRCLICSMSKKREEIRLVPDIITVKKEAFPGHTPYDTMGIGECGNFSVSVYGNETGEPHVHVFDFKGQRACSLKLTKAEYYYHYDGSCEYDCRLSPDEIAEIAAFLKSDNMPFSVAKELENVPVRDMFSLAVKTWNALNPAKAIEEDTPMPDYTFLKKSVKTDNNS